MNGYVVSFGALNVQPHPPVNNAGLNSAISGSESESERGSESEDASEDQDEDNVLVES